MVFLLRSFRVSIRGIVLIILISWVYVLAIAGSMSLMIIDRIRLVFSSDQKNSVNKLHGDHIGAIVKQKLVKAKVSFPNSFMCQKLLFNPENDCLRIFLKCGPKRQERRLSYLDWR